MEFINDISFVIGGKLVVLIEHQSTVNPNIALRLLMYEEAVCVCEKHAKNSKTYTHDQVLSSLLPPNLWRLARE